MRKLYFVICLLLIFLGGNIYVSAMILKPSGPTIGRRGEEVTLYIQLERNEKESEVSAIEGILVYDENILELKDSSIVLDNWTDFAEVGNNKIFSYGNIYFDNLINKTNQNIIELIFKVKDTAEFGNTSLYINNTNATDNEGNGVLIEDGNHTIKILSDINTLSNISIEGANIEFDEDKGSYDITLDSDSTSINTVKKDESSVVSGDIGNRKLDYGLNTFNVVVTSESGLKKTYILNITRPDNRSRVNTLSSLEVNIGKIIFDKDKLSYNFNVEYDVTDVKIDAILTDDKSVFVESFGPRNEKLNVGKNIIEIKVKAENEDLKVYTLNIVREEEKKIEEEDKNTEKEEIDKNLSTGDTWIIPICIIGLLSLVFVIWYYTKKKKK